MSTLAIIGCVITGIGLLFWFAGGCCLADDVPNGYEKPLFYIGCPFMFMGLAILLVCACRM